MNSKILITGADGDLGKVLVSSLKKKYSIYEMVFKPRNENQVYGDLLDFTSLNRVVKDIDLVIHCAALQKGKKRKIWETNALGTANLVSACLKNNIKGMIFISSYDIKFPGVYGQSKLKAEEIIKESGLNYLILRPTVIYGKDFTKNIGKLINIEKRYPFVPVCGKGDNLYQPVYAGDLTKIIDKSLERKLKNKTYFVGGSEIISMEEMADLISRELNKRIFKVRFPKNLFELLTGAKVTDKTVPAKDLRKLESDFGIRLTGITEGIKYLL